MHENFECIFGHEIDYTRVHCESYYLVSHLWSWFSFTGETGKKAQTVSFQKDNVLLVVCFWEKYFLSTAIDSFGNSNSCQLNSLAIRLPVIMWQASNWNSNMIVAIEVLGLREVLSSLLWVAPDSESRS